MGRESYTTRPLTKDEIDAIENVRKCIENGELEPLETRTIQGTEYAQGSHPGLIPFVEDETIGYLPRVEGKYVMAGNKSKYKATKKCSRCSVQLHIIPELKEFDHICYGCTKATDFPHLTIIDLDLRYKHKIDGILELSNVGVHRTYAGRPIAIEHNWQIEDSIYIYGIKDKNNILYGSILLKTNKDTSRQVTLTQADIMPADEVINRDEETTKQPGSDTEKQPGSDTEKQPVSDTEKQPVSDTEKQPGSDTEKQPGSDTEKQPGSDTEKGKESHDIETCIIKYVDTYEFPENVSEDEKGEVKSFINEDKDKIEAILNQNKDQILKAAVQDYCTRVIADKEEKKRIEEKDRLEKEQEKKEKDRIKKIDKSLENISPDAIIAIENGTLFLEGPPGTSKSYDAEKIACEIVNAYIPDKEKDFTFEELKDMGLVDRIELDSSWSNNDLMGGMTYLTEEEDKAADNVRPISKSGRLMKMNKRNIGLALKLSKEEIESKTFDKIFDDNKKRVGDKNTYKYAGRHVFLVEEASRGNFESIFGGTMTILEKERRLGEDNQTSVTNRSGYCRALAPSMVVICTRNIADKGAKSIDIGIMRRFPRLYRRPDFKRIENYIQDNKEKLEKEGIFEDIEDSIKALKIINNRMANHSQLGIDYQIGHTYLYVKSESELISKWKYWILPSILDRCNRKQDVFIDILFDDPELEDKQKVMSELENIKDLDSLNSIIDKIIRFDINEPKTSSKD